MFRIIQIHAPKANAIPVLFSLFSILIPPAQTDVGATLAGLLSAIELDEQSDVLFRPHRAFDVVWFDFVIDEMRDCLLPRLIQRLADDGCAGSWSSVQGRRSGRHIAESTWR